MSDLVEKARVFATAAHSGIGQVRKYTDEPYIYHPLCVVTILKMSVLGVTSEMLAAAWLHDVVEDTQITQELITDEFGNQIGDYVYGLTNKSNKFDGNRVERKAIDALFLAQQCAEVQTIKYADLIHNTASIVRYDPKFAKVYLPEKLSLLKAMTLGDKNLRSRALKDTQTSLQELGISYE